MTRSAWGAIIIGTVLGVALGSWTTLWLLYHEAHPVAKFAELDCYLIKDEFEPWHTTADGQILHVGNQRYMAVTREQRNGNLRYDGYKTYGFEIRIVEADREWKKTVCPQVWMR